MGLTIFHGQYSATFNFWQDGTASLVGTMAIQAPFVLLQTLSVTSALTVTSIIMASALLVRGVQVVGGQLSAIADPPGSGDMGARATIRAILSALRMHGLIAT